MLTQIPEQIEYFVSICVMTKGTNTFGHSYMMLSCLDRSKKDAKVEVVESIGLYSRYMPVLGYKPISRGRVKTEDPNSLVNRSGLYHKTFAITEEELASLFASVNADRRMFNKDDKQIRKDGTPETKPGGPLFNLFTGKNCKDYSLKKMEDLGIDVKSMRRLLELPRFTPEVFPLKLIEDKNNQKIYWESPLTISPHQKAASYLTRDVKLTHQFYALIEGVDNIHSLLHNRKEALKKLGRTVVEIDTAFTEIQKVKESLSQIAPFPNALDTHFIDTTKSDIKKIVLKCTDSLKSKGIEQSLRFQLLDTLKEMCNRITYGWFGLKAFTDKENSLDCKTFSYIDRIQNNMTS